MPTVDAPDTSVLTHFSAIRDPRSEPLVYHTLPSMFAIAICAIVCGADSWAAVERWGNAKSEWLAGIIELPYGIPSHDTFSRVFSILNPSELQQAFMTWIRTVATATEGEVLAIDGKTLRRSFDRAGGVPAIHMVSAWASANAMVIGQVKTEEKSNEITAIPNLLRLLELRGCIVTIDAMGCQKKIAQTIVEGGGDYVLAVKENQPNLYEDIMRIFRRGQAQHWRTVPVAYGETSESGHGRIEHRAGWITNKLSGLRNCAEWTGLRSIGWVQATRTANGKTSVFSRYFITSLSGDDAEVFLNAVRSHWGVENKLHWSLDLAFREDECRIRKGHGAENMARMRHMALNLLRQEKSVKNGIAIKRQLAGWDNDYLLQVLGVCA